MAKSFMQLYRAGEATADEVDDHVHIWHKRYESANQLEDWEQLEAFLGMTFDEYNEWVRTGNLPTV